jgi:hypothetical protein
MTSKTQRWLTWVMAAVALLLLLLCSRAWLIGWYVLKASCRELILGSDSMNALGGIARVGLLSFLELGFFIVTILVALGWITSRRVRIALWAFSMVLYGMMAALGVASTMVSLSWPVHAATLAMDCVITICFVVITNISVSLFRRSLSTDRPETPSGVS